ncbi:NUDIX domain-containing protein [Geothrix campi]|uniref:NUDIX domain-containing protein n=1 Tax=Geothrix campi TaxID=2966450 RepID=UPI002147C005|nr:NUDIX domain-containing protein [Geothrix sp. SG10]
MTDVALALIRREGRCFLQRRAAANPVLPGLWEFPGGKVEPSETPLAALRRELLEEVAMELGAATALPVLQGPVCLHPFLVDAPGQPRTDLAWGWFTLKEIAALPIPPANAALLHDLERAL